MIQTPLIKKAISFAKWAHHGQTRKYTNEPYINHPINVAEIVSTVTNDEEMIAAAILHDTIEDTTATEENLLKEFGARIAGLVMEVTDVSKPEDGNRRARKEKDAKHLAKASPAGQTIKLADLIDNTSTIEKYDPQFAHVYMNEKKHLLWNSLLQGNGELYSRAEKQIRDYYNQIIP